MEKFRLKRLFENDFVIYEGHNRHEALLRSNGVFTSKE